MIKTVLRLCLIVLFCLANQDISSGYVAKTKSTQKNNHAYQAVTTLCSALLSILTTLDTHLAYWQTEITNNTSDHAVQAYDYLVSEWNHAAGYLGALYALRTSLKSSEENNDATKKAYFLLDKCLEDQPLGQNTYDYTQHISSRAQQAPYVLAKTIVTYKIKTLRRISRYQAPGHLARNWKRYAGVAIALVATASCLYYYRNELKNGTQSLRELWRAHIAQPIKELWGVISGKENIPLPHLEPTPWALEEERAHLQALIAADLEHKARLNLQQELSAQQNSPAPTRSSQSTRHEGLFGDIFAAPWEQCKNKIQEQKPSDFSKNNLLFRLKEALFPSAINQANLPQLPTEQRTAIQQDAYQRAHHGILGEDSVNDMTTTYNSPYAALANGQAIRLGARKGQKLIVDAAKLSHEVRLLVAFCQTKFQALWKVLRVMGIFSLLPASLLTYKGYSLLTKKKMVINMPIQLIIRDLERIFIKDLEPNQTNFTQQKPTHHQISFVHQGVALYLIQKIKKAAPTLVAAEQQSLLLTDLADLERPDFSAHQKLAVIQRMYHTYAFLEHRI